FAAMVGIATANRFYLMPRLPGAPALRALQRNSLAETALGICVLLFVGMLGTLPPAAHRHAAPRDNPPDAAFVHIHTAEAMADVMINPGRPGPAQVTIRVTREDFSLYPAKDVRLALEPPTRANRPVEQDAVQQPGGGWRFKGPPAADPGLGMAGFFSPPERGPLTLLAAPIVVER